MNTASTHQERETSTELYLELIKCCLVNSIYEDAGKQVTEWSPTVEKLIASKNSLARRIVTFFGPLVVNHKRAEPFDSRIREEGRDFPSIAHTMIGRKRIDNIQMCVEDALHNNVPGDLIETGVWRGGSTILMRAILKAHGLTDRNVWVADSFEGVPRPNAKKYEADAGDRFHAYSDLAVSLEDVQENFRRYGLLDDQVKFLKGWFSDTLPTAPIEQLAVMRLDGDMYESTMDALVHLYPKLSVGGYVLVDDYGSLPPAQRAVDDYRQEHGIKDEVQFADWTGVFWRRS